MKHRKSCRTCNHPQRIDVFITSIAVKKTFGTIFPTTLSGPRCLYHQNILHIDLQGRYVRLPNQSRPLRLSSNGLSASKSRSCSAHSGALVQTSGSGALERGFSPRISLTLLTMAAFEIYSNASSSSGGPLLGILSTAREYTGTGSSERAPQTASPIPPAG